MNTVIKEEAPPRPATVFRGNFSEDMEIAKHLINQFPNVDLSMLTAIARDTNQPESSRVAAIYTLGFTDDQGRSRSVLSGIIGDAHQSDIVKDYAQEALTSITPHH